MIHTIDTDDAAAIILGLVGLACFALSWYSDRENARLEEDAGNHKPKPTRKERLDCDAITARAAGELCEEHRCPTEWCDRLPHSERQKGGVPKGANKI